MVIRSAIRPAVRSPLRGALESRFGQDNGLSITAPSAVLFADGDQPIYLADWQSHNLLKRSEDFSADWTNGGAMTAASGATPPSPYSASTTFTTVNTSESRLYSEALTLDANTWHAFELVVNSNDVPFVYLYPFNPGVGGTIAYFDMSDGSIGSLGGNLKLAYSKDLGTGWYKLVVALDVGAVTSWNFLWGFADANGFQAVTAGLTADVTGAVVRYASADPTYSETTGTADTPVASYGAFTLTDAQYDSGADSYNATATITAGNLTVSPSFETGGQNALTYSPGDGDADATFTATGATLDDLNAALNKLAVDGLSSQTANVTVSWSHPATTRAASKTISIESTGEFTADAGWFTADTTDYTADAA